MQSQSSQFVVLTALGLALVGALSLLACGPASMASGAGGQSGGGGATGTGGAPVTCGAGTIVETGGTAGAGDWAEWPMPNGSVDVAAGAPNAQSYTDNGDGTVTDNVTGLMWQQTPPAARTYTRADAVAYCPSLTLAGHGDWRLPSLIELVSLVDAGRAEPSINATYFPATIFSPGAPFRSSSLFARDPAVSWVLEFGLGGSYGVGLLEEDVVRCVRAFANASAPAARYTMAGGTICDAKTKLTWQQTAPLSTYTWADAKAYCANVGASLGGTGWRLPTLNELQTIVDYSRVLPSIAPTVFPATPVQFSDFFWCSSRVAGSRTIDAWAVDFNNGNADLDDMSTMHYARCVR